MGLRPVPLPQEGPHDQSASEKLRNVTRVERMMEMLSFMLTKRSNWYENVKALFWLNYQAQVSLLWTRLELVSEIGIMDDVTDSMD